MIMRMSSILLAVLISTACGSTESETPLPSAENSTESTDTNTDNTNNTGTNDNTDNNDNTDTNDNTDNTGNTDTDDNTDTNDNSNENPDNGPVDLSTLDLNGTLPPEQLEAPTFMATNRDGTSRSQEDLVGQPTVMWFFPLANTAG